jgi:DNA polymerase-1
MITGGAPILGGENKVLNVEAVPPNDTIGLVDADTLVYAVCSVCEYGDDEAGYQIDLEYALKEAHIRISDIQEICGCKAMELHFTSGTNFRHKLTDTYKSNRKDTRYPEGLGELKQLLLKEYNGIIHTEIEADDHVVWAKKYFPELYTLIAVDKDVLNSVAGKHFNYYQSSKYNIPMKWMEVEHEYTSKFPFLQCLMGDATDGIGGVPKVGPKKAEKLLAGVTDTQEMWNIVVGAYKAAGLDEKLAILNMRLVSMHQLNEKGELELWTEATHL